MRATSRSTGQVSLDTDQQVDLSDNLPLRVRVRLQVDDPAVPGQWVDALFSPVDRSRSIAMTSPGPMVRSSGCSRGLTGLTYWRQAARTRSSARIT